MATPSRSAERFKYGICLNDECQECKNKTVQQLPMRKELVCSSCGKPLRECPPPKPGPNWKLIGIAAGAVVAVGGIATFLAVNGHGDSKPTEPVQEPVAIVDSDSIKRAIALEEQRVKDSLKADSIAKISATATKATKTTTPPPPTQTTINLGYGVYEGPIVGGKADGIGGSIRFTRSYSIDLKKASGETVDVSPGDRLINVKMKDNRIIQGQLKRADGSQRFIVIG